MTYKFENFTGTIVKPTIEVVSVSDNLNTKTCSVDIKLTSGSNEFGVNLSGFTYTDTWEDADITAWVNTELDKYTA